MYFQNYSEIRSMILKAVWDAARTYSPLASDDAFKTDKTSAYAYADDVATKLTLEIEHKATASTYSGASSASTKYVPYSERPSRHEALLEVVKRPTEAATSVPVPISEEPAAAAAEPLAVEPLMDASALVQAG